MAFKKWEDSLLVIVPPEGKGIKVSEGTKFILDGEELRGVSKCTVHFDPFAVIWAEVELVVDAETINAQPMLGLPTIKAAAALYNYDLAPRAMSSYFVVELWNDGDWVRDFEEVPPARWQGGMPEEVWHAHRSPSAEECKEYMRGYGGKYRIIEVRESMLEVVEEEQP